MIAVENLSFVYRKSKRAVLHDFSLTLEQGRVYGLLGKNGAGKSTLLYLMSGLLTPKSGRVMYHDMDVRRRLPLTLQDMFLVPEEFELPAVSLTSYVELNSPFYPRFSKEDMVENWKANVLRLALMYGVMTVVLLWMGYLGYRYKTSLVDDESVWQSTLVFFMWCLWGFGCLNASFTMEKMKNKTSRLSTLMTPATPFEKYFSRWLVSIVVFLIVFLISFRLADYTRVLVYTLVYPELKAIAALPFSHFVGDNVDYYTLCRTANDFILVIVLYFFTQSCFVLGSSIWPQNAFLKTFVAGAIVLVSYVLLIVWMNDLFQIENSLERFVEKEAVFTVLSIVCSAFTLFNWTLAYFRFKESEIINRM